MSDEINSACAPSAPVALSAPSAPRRGKFERGVREPRRELNGVLLLDKPLGLSSHEALMRVKGMFRAKKAGHTGTLDPMATGLLPLCFGEATKFSQDLLDADKSYEATMRLGERTDTGDAEGQVIDTREVVCDLAAVDAAMARFRGPIEQVPPMYSALKRDGKPLYEYAREGVTIERESRTVTIYQLERLSDAAVLADARELCFRVTCSKGTYIRTLAEDIGEALGCGAHLVALRRTGVATLSLAQAVTMDALQALRDAGSDASPFDASNLLQPVDALLSRFPAIMLDAEQARRVRHGQRLRLLAGTVMRVPEGAPAADPAHDDIGRVRLYAPEGGLIGTADLRAGRLAPERLIDTTATSRQP